MVEYWIQKVRQKRKEKKQKRRVEENEDDSNAWSAYTAQHIERPPETPFPFLKLPPEVRNRVYDLIHIQDTVIFFDYDCQRPVAVQSHYERLFNEHMDEQHKILMCCTQHLFSYSLADHERRSFIRYSTSLPALYRVNKQLYTETIHYLYSKTTFGFQSMQSVKRFMRATQHSDTLCSIRSLELSLQTYGSPRSAKNVPMLSKSYAGLSRMILEMSSRMSNVSTFKLFLDVKEWPLALTFCAPWVQPVLELRNFSKICDVHITISTFLQESYDQHLLRISTGNDAGQPQPITSESRNAMKFVTETHHLFEQALVLYVLGRSKHCALEAFRERVHRNDASLDKFLREVRGSDLQANVQRIKDWSRVDHQDVVPEIQSDDLEMDPFPDLADDLFVYANDR